jgi:hypothetical protein
MFVLFAALNEGHRLPSENRGNFRTILLKILKINHFYCIIPGLDSAQIRGKFVKTIFMAAAPALDSEFMQYWLKLSLVQKESLLSVAKNFVGLQSETDVIDLRKKLIREEREKYLQEEGKSFSWQEVKNMALNKDKRNGL